MLEPLKNKDVDENLPQSLEFKEILDPEVGSRPRYRCQLCTRALERALAGPERRKNRADIPTIRP